MQSYKRRTNLRQLVLRRDTATGMTLVGWEEDLPVGRFEHLKLVCESASNILPARESEAYAAYQSAISFARTENIRMLVQQSLHHQAEGWYRVPFDLAHNQHAMRPDSIGNYAAAAMQLQFQLTRNCKQAWAIALRGTITHVRARYPKKQLDELTYQVWYHSQLHQLNQLDGDLLEGSLMICESGLWFAGKKM